MPKPGLLLPSRAQPPWLPGGSLGEEERRVWWLGLGQPGAVFLIFGGWFFLGGGERGGSLVCPWRNREGEGFLSTG